MILRYKKLYENARTPQRANPSDAGLDVFFSKENEGEYKEGNTLLPGQSARFSTGLAFEIPHGYMLQVMNRSSMASKRNLVVGACVCDPLYENQIFIDLHNVGHEKQIVLVGDKIAQIVCVPVIHFEAIESDEIYNSQKGMSNRGLGGFGSTDKPILSSTTARAAWPSCEDYKEKGFECCKLEGKEGE